MGKYFSEFRNFSSERRSSSLGIFARCSDLCSSESDVCLFLVSLLGDKTDEFNIILIIYNSSIISRFIAPFFSLD
jgi:hypothetical protein